MGFFSRLWLAFVTFWRIVLNRDVPRPSEGLRVLALLQREGRLIDFVEEEIAAYSDAQIGAAARTVHDGCRKALREYVKLEPVRIEAEGAPIEIPAGFDPQAVRLTGNVVGNPPFRGVLRHHGWRSPDGVVAPAEVELP